jgi:alkylation response protein AidB-like acyl-CoA dehydrogenase
MGTPQESPELFDLRMSEEARPLMKRVTQFLEEVVAPMQEEFYALEADKEDRWSYAPGQLELLDGAKAKAREAGLWNFFLPGSEVGGLSNLDYAYIAVELGKYPLGSESLNCSAPDTGNMEVLERVGTPEQKKQWLEPLLNGEIRSCFGMTEPGLASSDARNIATQAVLDGDEWVINGEKYYISGAGDPRCKIMICMVRTNPDAAAHLQQSQILVPMDTPGVEILGPMHVFGDDGARSQWSSRRPGALSPVTMNKAKLSSCSMASCRRSNAARAAMPFRCCGLQMNSRSTSTALATAATAPSGFRPPQGAPFSALSIFRPRSRRKAMSIMTRF